MSLLWQNTKFENLMESLKCFWKFIQNIKSPRAGGLSWLPVGRIIGEQRSQVLSPPLTVGCFLRLALGGWASSNQEFPSWESLLPLLPV